MNELQIAELKAIKHLITKCYPSGVVSIVSDTFDFFNVITNIASELKETILNRGVDSNGLSKVVFRPDSGDPVRIICGYKPLTISGIYELDNWDIRNSLVPSKNYYAFNYDGKYDAVRYKDKFYEIEYSDEIDNYDERVKYTLGKELSEEEIMGAAGCLWNIFGGTVNSKGYKELNSKVGLIYGDSITLQRANNILEGLKSKGFASGNIVFGIGSYTYQCITRDTLGFAMKATYGVINGEPVEIFKNPKTDDGTKKSARGLLKVYKKENDYILHDRVSVEEYNKEDDCLYTVYNGILYEDSFSQIRKRLEK